MTSCALYAGAWRWRLSARGRTICDQCGSTIERNAAHLLYVNRSAYRTFCSPESLGSYLTPDELCIKKDSTRESPD
jgi:hypothetical protein